MVSSASGTEQARRRECGGGFTGGDCRTALSRLRRARRRPGRWPIFSACCCADLVRYTGSFGVARSRRRHACTWGDEVPVGERLRCPGVMVSCRDAQLACTRPRPGPPQCRFTSSRIEYVAAGEQRAVPPVDPRHGYKEFDMKPTHSHSGRSRSRRLSWRYHRQPFSP